MRRHEILSITMSLTLLAFVAACSPNHTGNQSNNLNAPVGHQTHLTQTGVSGNHPHTPSKAVNETASSPAANPTSATYTYALANAELTSDEDSEEAQLIQEFKDAIPHQWGEHTTGVLTHMNTKDKVIALTFDACGGRGGSGYDGKLINYLIQQHIPATLFINGRWIDENYATFMSLANNPLFEIENHGYLHSPLSINGKSAWGIPGTKNAGQVVDEVLVNADKIERLTGRRPIYFRSGTAYYDEDAVQIAKQLGIDCVNYDILGDAGATFNTQQIVHACLQAKPGSIIICHMNHPEKDTAEGIMAVVPLLKQRGFRFVKLDEYPLV